MVVAVDRRAKYPESLRRRLEPNFEPILPHEPCRPTSENAVVYAFRLLAPLVAPVYHCGSTESTAASPQQRTNERAGEATTVTKGARLV